MFFKSSPADPTTTLSNRSFVTDQPLLTEQPIVTNNYQIHTNSNQTPPSTSNQHTPTLSSIPRGHSSPESPPFFIQNRLGTPLQNEFPTESHFPADRFNQQPLRENTDNNQFSSDTCDLDQLQGSPSYYTPDHASYAALGPLDQVQGVNQSIGSTLGQNVFDVPRSDVPTWTGSAVGPGPACAGFNDQTTPQSISSHYYPYQYYNPSEPASRAPLTLPRAFRSFGSEPCLTDSLSFSNNPSKGRKVPSSTVVSYYEMLNGYHNQGPEQGQSTPTSTWSWSHPAVKTMVPPPSQFSTFFQGTLQQCPDEDAPPISEPIDRSQSSSFSAAAFFTPGTPSSIAFPAVSSLSDQDASCTTI
jgi:hypothetical protein